MSEVFDNCDSISDWKISSSKLPPNEGDNTLEVDTIDKVEGIGSLKGIFGATGPNWGGMFYKRAKAFWDFSQKPVLKIIAKLGAPIPAEADFFLEFVSKPPPDYPWNSFIYEIRDKLVVGDWVILSVDLRLPDRGPAGKLPDLRYGAQIGIASWGAIYSTPVPVNLDHITKEPGPPIPLQGKITPESATITIGDSVTFSVMALGGAQPYTYEWYVNAVKQSSVTDAFEFTAIEKNSYTVECVVADATNASITLSASVTVTGLPPIPREPRLLHTAGACLYNDRRERVHLHGVHSVNFGDSSAGWWIWGPYYNWDEEALRKNLEVLANWGCNFIYFSAVTPDRLANNTKYTVGGGVDSADIGLMDAVKKLIEIAYQYGIYVAIGMDNEVFVEPPEKMEMVWYWAPNHLEEWIAFWIKISRELRIYPNVIYGMNAEPAISEDEMNAYFNAIVQAVQAIRTDGDEHIFFYHEDYCIYPARFDKPATEGGEMIRKLHEYATNIVYSGHIYRWHGTFGGDPDHFDPTASAIEPGYVDYDGVYTREDIIEALTYFGYKKILEEYKVPIIMGEGGPAKAERIQSPNTWEKEIACYKNLLQVLNEWNVGYAGFWWRQPETEGPVFSPFILPGSGAFIPNEWGQDLINACATAPTPVTPGVSPAKIVVAATGLTIAGEILYTIFG